MKSITVLDRHVNETKTRHNAQYFFSLYDKLELYIHLVVEYIYGGTYQIDIWAHLWVWVTFNSLNCLTYNNPN